MSRQDDFYVGYMPSSPPSIARHTRLAVAGLLLLGLTIGLGLTLGQSTFDYGIFEFGDARSFHGIALERPTPMLAVPDGAGGWETHYLVALGKFGAQAAIDGLDGRPVRLQGTRVYNHQRRMIELTDDPVEVLGVSEMGALQESDASTATALTGWSGLPQQALGVMTLRGEIVDSKCHLGVMKPGRAKPHKACAIRCISGGIPPVLRVQHPDGRLSYLLLASAGDSPVHKDVLPYVAEPVEVTGQAVRQGDQIVLRVDPSDGYRLLTAEELGS